MIVRETWIVETTKDIEIDIDPKDYLWCETEEELQDAILEDLSSSADSSDVEKWIEPIDFYMDDNITMTWKTLKEKENG